MIEAQGRTGDEPETGSHTSSTSLVCTARTVRIKNTGDDEHNFDNNGKTE